MKQKDNKIVVGARLMDGNEIKVSTSVNFFKEFTSANKEELITQIKKKIEPFKDDILYYSYKLLYKDKHDNQKFDNLDKLLEMVGTVGS